MEVVKTEAAKTEGEVKDPLKVPEPVLEPKAQELSSEEKLVASIADFKFLRYENGVLQVTHDEYKGLIKPKILKMGDLVRRGNIISNLSGSSSKPDEQTATLNSCIATIQVGFEALNLDLLSVVDSDLIIGLYTVVCNYNSFFRKTPLGFVL